MLTVHGCPLVAVTDRPHGRGRRARCPTSLPRRAGRSEHRRPDPAARTRRTATAAVADGTTRVAVTMRCAHGATRHAPGADRTRPADLRPGHRSAVGRQPAAGSTRRPVRHRPRRRPGRHLPPGRAARGRCPVGLRPPVLARTLPRVPWWPWPWPPPPPSRATLGTCVMQLPLAPGPGGGQAGRHPAVPDAGTVRPRRRGGEPRRASTSRPASTTTPGAASSMPASPSSGGRGPPGTASPPATPTPSGPARYRQLPEPPAVPVWVGGSSEAALRRAADIGRRMDAPVPEPRPSTARPSSGWPRRSTGPAGPPTR